MTRYFLLFLFLLIVSQAGAQVGTTFIQSLKDPSKQQQHWVDSVFRKLNRKERIAQLFMVRAHTNLGKKYEDSVAAVIRKERVGGLVFFQGGPGRQLDLTRRYQALANVPLLVAQDGEWGLGMRLDSTVSYPYQMTLGAIQDNSLIYEMGKMVAQDFHRLGMSVNFAPDIDINNNPANPVIGYRSFGDNKLKVAAKGAAYMKGMQDQGLLVSLKHFPGHGDTDVDSHLDLPQLPFSRERLDSLEMYPFRELIRAGASGVMVAHMSIPALDATPHLPSTLSAPIITGILKKDLGFNGIIFSDAMEMKGVVKYFPDGEADVRALIAGNDVVELSQNSGRAIKMVRKAIRQKRLPKDQVFNSVKKVLAAKYWSMNNRGTLSPDTGSLVNYLSRPEVKVLNQRLSDAAVTVLKSDSGIRSLKPGMRLALVSTGVSETTLFQNEMKARFPGATNFILSKIASATDIAAMMQELRKYDAVVLAIHDYRKRPAATLDYNSELNLAIAAISRLNTVTCVFANPYTIARLPGIEQSRTILMNYQNSDEMQLAAAKVLSGDLKATGKLPVTINAFFKNGDGL